MRFGAGVKGKINQSMAFGVPVVATSLAVEGMELTDREDILVADEPEDFARALIELYESKELWNRSFRRTAFEKHATFIRPTRHARSWSFCSAMSISGLRGSRAAVERMEVALA